MDPNCLQTLIAGRKSREREREMFVWVCVLFEFRQFVFRLRISKFCVDLCKKKSDRTRCLAVSIFEYNLGGTILTGIRSRQSERKRFGFLKEERNSVMIHW